MHRRTWLLLPATLLPRHATAEASVEVIRVGLGKDVPTLAEAARRAVDGSVIEVDAGDYVGDVAVWTKNRLTLRAVGGRVRLHAGNAAAEGKGIWVVRSQQMLVDGFDFLGAKVAHRNGAGIRFERGALRVQNCTFTDNENGILAANEATARLEVVDCHFARNGHGDGYSHNLYVGAIATLEVTGSSLQQARKGHLLKSRAAHNLIRYNLLSDGIGGQASYELEFPSGGVALVIGNIIQQDSQTQNPHLISYGVEDYRWPANRLYLVHNTLVDKLPAGGIFLRVQPGEARVHAVNNLLVGRGTLDGAAPGHYAGNFTVDWDVFMGAARDDYRLRPDAPMAGKAVDPGTSSDGDLRQHAQYAPLRGTLALASPPRSPGAVHTLPPGTTNE